MEKISFTEIKKMLRAGGIALADGDVAESVSYVGVSHAHGWDHGYETYYGYNGSRREFYSDLFTVERFLNEYIGKCGISSFIVFPFYHGAPFVHNYRYCRYYDDIVSEIRDFLRENGLSHGTRSGAKISSGDVKAVSMVLEGAFRGASQLCLFSYERNVVIEPDHHFQVSIWTTDPEREKETLKSIISGYPELSLYYKNAGR